MRILRTDRCGSFFSGLGKGGLLLIACLGLAGAIATPVMLRGQTPVSEEEFTAESLRYRTALHYDPLLDAPLESLVKLYVGAGRADELIALYRTHIEQYPADAGAKTVLIRVLRRVNREGTDEAISTVVPQHPDYAPLQYVLFRYLEEKGDPRATEALSRAIDLETNPTRRNEWLDQLLRLSEGDAARSLAEGHFQRLLAPADLALEDLMSLARLMQRYRFWEPSIVALTRAQESKPTPETEVEINLLLATALKQTGRETEAAVLLDRQLSRLAAGHWRRREILSLRLEAVASEKDREAYVAKLEQALATNPASESAVLDYAEALAAVERRDEAVSVLTSALVRLPKSTLIETRALEWLETSSDLESYARFLADRLETDPSRLDLRFRLVKAQYALGRDAAAEQDFKAVVAGMEPADASSRILELQRYLRGIERLDAAADYLERYVRNYPTRLDVARELAEIRIATGQSASIGDLVRLLQPEEAETENVLDFAAFLLEGNFVHAARMLVGAKLAQDPRQFDLGLRLIEILGRAGDANATGANIALFRDLADTPPRYAQWLEASVAAHRALETLPAFFDTELNRYQFDDGAWSAEKVDRFLILCEAGKRQFLTNRVAEGLRKQLAQPGLDPGLRLRLRKVLVTVLEADPASAPEAEEQLRLLTEEDPAARAEYDLRRVLVYHRSQRIDLAQALVVSVDLTEVSDPALLRDVSDLLVDYGFFRDAEVALATINRLEPADFLSWERRISILVTLENESSLRALLRTLATGEAGVSLRELSNQSLDQHLDASYWRSIARLLREGVGRYGEILPLLASAELEVVSANSRLWSEWTRAHVLSRLGQSQEAAEAMARFRTKAKERSLDVVRFPDGLELSVDAAGTALRVSGGDVDTGAENGDEEDLSAEFLLEQPFMQWAFELPEGATVRSIHRSDGHLLVLDDLDHVSVLDVSTGKLLWRAPFSRSGRRELRPVPAAFSEVAAPSPLLRKPGKHRPQAGMPREIAVSGERFFLIRDGELTANSVTSGITLWTAALPGATEATGASIRFAVGDDLVVVFESSSHQVHAFEVVSGKLAWHVALPAAEDRDAAPGVLSALNTGLSVQGGRALVYGRTSAIIDLATGQTVWTLGGDPPSRFPVVLRPDRGDEAASPGGPAPDAPTMDPVALRPPALFDFQAREGDGLLIPDEFLAGDSTLLSPAQYWVQSRKRSMGSAFGLLTPGSLWLMADEKVRRISNDLPAASQELPASGTWIGRAGNHVWFLQGSNLVHADFARDRVSRLSLHDLGDPGSIRATVVGNQVIARGSASIRLINALSGEVLGQTDFPATLMDYLKGFAADFAGPPMELDREDYTWQGRVRREDPATAGLALPVSDLVRGSQYHTIFARRLVVSLSAGNPGESPPPAPGDPGDVPPVAPR